MSAFHKPGTEAAPPATPTTVGIIGGAGRMGQMFGPLFAASGLRVLVSDVDSELSNAELVAEAEVVIFAVPMRETVPLIRNLAPLLRPEQLVSDFTSIKAEPVAAMLESAASVIGCHPVFGPLPNPEGQNLALCPARPGPFLPWYRGFFCSHGIRVVELTPQEHDEAMGFIQGLTHFIHIVSARTLHTRKVDVQHLLQLCSPVYRIFFAMLSRILSGDPVLYGQIQITNPANVPLLKTFQKNSTELLQLVEAKDFKKTYALIQHTADYLGTHKDNAKQESDLLIEHLQKLLTTPSDS